MLFCKIWYRDRWVSSETKEPRLKNWVYFEQIIAKSTQFGQNGVLSIEKRYTDEWVIGQKIGIEKVEIFELRQAHPHTILAKVTPPALKC